MNSNLSCLLTSNGDKLYIVSLMCHDINLAEDYR